MSVKESLQQIIDSLQEAVADAEKFDNGNASAGTRVRKAAQTAKAELQALRLEVQEIKTARASS